MTFCFAWKNKNDISIIADSLITLNKDSKSKKTSFDENIKDFRIEEKDSKLCVIRNTIVSYAGDISGGLADILSHYEKYYEDNISEVENLKNAVYTDIREGENIEFLLAYVDKNKKSYLYKLKFKGTKIIKQTYEVVRNADLNMLEERIWILASLQYYGLNSPQIKNGIGGIFKVISLVNEEIKWSDNIKYDFGIFNNNKFESKNNVELLSFQNHIYVKSDYLKNGIILTNCMEKRIVIPPFRQISYDFYIFRNISNRNVLIIPQKKYDDNMKEKYMKQLIEGKNNKGIAEFEQIGIIIEKEYYSFFYFVSHRYSNPNFIYFLENLN